jgi:hypothetical protein
MSDDRGEEGDDGPPYTVGYGKPPLKSQFQPGQSGNPGGRKKTPVSEDQAEFWLLVKAALNKSIAIAKDGQTIVTTRAELGGAKLARQLARGGKHAGPARRMLKALELFAPPKKENGVKPAPIVLPAPWPQDEVLRWAREMRLPINPLEGVPGAEGMWEERQRMLAARGDLAVDPDPAPRAPAPREPRPREDFKAVLDRARRVRQRLSLKR